MDNILRQLLLGCKNEDGVKGGRGLSRDQEGEIGVADEMSWEEAAQGNEH